MTLSNYSPAHARRAPPGKFGATQTDADRPGDPDIYSFLFTRQDRRAKEAVCLSSLFYGPASPDKQWILPTGRAASSPEYDSLGAPCERLSVRAALSPLSGGWSKPRPVQTRVRGG